MSKFLVTGATGKLGGASVEALLRTVSAEQVSVLARDPAKAPGLTSRGVNVVKGDYFDYQSLVDAFRGVDRLLLIGAVSLSNRAPQHENMVKAVKAAGVGHVVYVSLQRREGSKVKLVEVTDVEDTAERALKDSSVPYTIVRNSLYSEAFKPILGADYLENGIQAFGPEGKTTYATIPDLAQANANLLLQSGHENKTYTLNAGEALSIREIAGLLGEVQGQPVEFRQVTRAEMVESLVARGVPLKNAEYLCGFLSAIAEGEFSETSDALEKILGRKPVTLRKTFTNDLKV